MRSLANGPGENSYMITLVVVFIEQPGGSNLVQACDIVDAVKTFGEVISGEIRVAEILVVN